MQFDFKNSIGIVLVVASLFDAWKYIWNSQAIKKVKTAKAHSRKFMNAAIFQDLIKLVYSITIMDFYIFISALLALVTMCICFYTIYQYYPYRMRGCQNFKRPNIFVYLLNSLIPNNLRKKL
jgi:hypothetical protein